MSFSCSNHSNQKIAFQKCVCAYKINPHQNNFPNLPLSPSTKSIWFAILLLFNLFVFSLQFLAFVLRKPCCFVVWVFSSLYALLFCFAKKYGFMQCDCWCALAWNVRGYFSHIINNQNSSKRLKIILLFIYSHTGKKWRDFLTTTTTLNVYGWGKEPE